MKKTVVIKLGSNIISDGTMLRHKLLKHVVSQIAALTGMGHRVVLVSSGAIASAMVALGKTQRPKTIVRKQAYAAIGQPLLMSTYAAMFKAHDLTVAQLLLTHDGIDHRERFVNAKNTLETLLHERQPRVIPIINENDTVTTDEIRFGDNDRLSASVATMIGADLLLILSHVDGLYDADPDRNPKAKLIRRIDDLAGISDKSVSARVTTLSTGGMTSKLSAAKICTESAIPVLVVNGLKSPDLIACVRSPEGVLGSYFVPQKKGQVLTGLRTHWLKHLKKIRGTLTIDEGAERALIEQKKSLLCVGILKQSGSFERGDALEILSHNGKLLARGLANYSASDLAKIGKAHSRMIPSLLGYTHGDEAVHRDHLVVMG